MSYRWMAWLAFLGGLIAALLIVLIIVLVSDDGGEEPGTSAAGTAATTTGAPATTAAPTTTGATTTGAPATTAAPTTTAGATTTALSPACAGLSGDSIPPSATDLTSVIGDMDGDGGPDVVTVFRDAGLWFVFVELDHGYATTASVPPFNEFSTPRATSVMDLGAIAEVALIETGFGLVGPVYGVWYLDGCDLDRATRDLAAPFEPFKGGGPVHSEGFTCTPDGIKLVNAAQPGADPAVWQVDEIFLVWAPLLGDFQTQGTNTYQTDPDTALAAAAGTGC